jgi:hypothetical protein
MDRVTATLGRPSSESQRFELFAFEGTEFKEILRWASGELVVGDEFVLRVVEREAADSPITREELNVVPADMNDIVERKRASECARL